MKRLVGFLSIVVCLSLLLGGVGFGSGSVPREASAEEEILATAEIQVEEEPTATATNTETATSTAEPTETATLEPTATTQSTVTLAPPATATATKTVVPTATRTPTATAVPVRINLSSTSGYVGSQLAIHAQKFSPNTRIAFYWAGGRKLTLTTNQYGSARGYLTIPVAEAGSYQVMVKGGGKSVSANFRVRPRLVSSRQTIIGGQSTKATLTGFWGSQTVSVRLYNSDGTVRLKTLGTITVSSLGQGAITVTIPKSIPSGSYLITAVQSTNRASDRVSITRPTFTPTNTPTKTATPRPTSTPTPITSIVFQGTSSKISGAFTLRAGTYSYRATLSGGGEFGFYCITVQNAPNTGYSDVYEILVLCEEAPYSITGLIRMYETRKVVIVAEEYYDGGTFKVTVYL